MLPQVYASWCRGLPDSSRALEILSSSRLIDGVELGNTNDDIEKIQSAGLMVSSHTPGLYHTMNLCAHDYGAILSSPEGRRTVAAIKKSDATFVGFHLGYSATELYKMSSHPNVPKEGKVITDETEILEKTVSSLLLLDELTNKNVAHPHKKNILIETLDLSRPITIDWSKQSTEAFNNKKSIVSMIESHGTNAALKLVTEPEYVRSVLKAVNEHSLEEVGFLFDIAHNYITATTRIFEGSYRGTVRNYFEDMLDAIEASTFQIHINVPGGDERHGYSDAHRSFQDGDRLSQEIIELCNLVIASSPRLKGLTLELRTGLSALEHARHVEQQAQLLLPKLQGFAR